MLTKLMDKIRPQVFMAVAILGIVAGYAMFMSQSEIAAGATGGIVALVKDIIQSDK
jgi:cyanophycinase-like exopeptidase